MTDSSAADSWLTANRDYLFAALGVLRAHVRAAAEQQDPSLASVAQAQAALAQVATRLSSASALENLVSGLGLTEFERDVLVLAAGPDLVAQCAEELHAVTGSPRLSFGAAMSLLQQPHWSALTPQAPLRSWQLVHLSDPDSPTRSPMVIDETILHHLAGLTGTDPCLAALSKPMPAREHLPDTLQQAVRLVATHWAAHRLVLLEGPQPANVKDVAAAAADAAGLRLRIVAAADLPGDALERRRLVRRMQRETILAGCAWAVDVADMAPADVARVVRGLCDIPTPMVLLGAGDCAAWTGVASDVVPVTVPRLPLAERRDVLSRAAGAHDEAASAVAGAAGAFDLPLADVDAVAGDVAAGVPIWDACRLRARRSFAGLAAVLQPRAGWADLVLPAAQLTQLHALAAQVRHRATVLDEWGFAARTTRGLATTALFAGPSGTGKTLAAEVIATELDVDLVHVDLSQLVSKYIGETEKNLRRLFADADDGAVVLLFDEADTIFGKRTQVRDSHDRYANLEVGYLLQRLESFRGLAILTTNNRAALDPAFLRRLGLVVSFPYPDHAARLVLWRGAFPDRTPRHDIDPGQLAAVDVPGGGVASIARNAAYLAAADTEVVTADHIATAITWELAKSGRVPDDAG
ncbi:ATP-binding protein [Catellatospora chokoriensis]|uniref:ATPase n=1 Tax=Catellatospora chokoriensis TaxID=310353 RepID=A0A8J3NSC2_9ACTN|nr:ATP-binding protein [Catellatospora chokoriensis]GIF90386.1 ATPase [Catellatospora chokoriensis]